jgi:hypothetical protein
VVPGPLLRVLASGSWPAPAAAANGFSTAGRVNGATWLAFCGVWEGAGLERDVSPVSALCGVERGGWRLRGRL